MHGTGAFTTFQSIWAGGRIITLEGRHFDAHELWRVVAKEKVTQMAIVGDAFAKPMLTALEEAEARAEKFGEQPYDISSLQTVDQQRRDVVGRGQAGTHEARGSFICFDSLGSSEGVGFANSITAPGAETATAKFSIGPDTRVFKENGEEVVAGSGEVGLLAVGGHIPVGYYKDDSKSAATFQTINGERWSVPGDFARVETDGSIVLLGRGSVVINSGGEKIYPEEVEEAIKRHPAVDDCLVVGVPDERFGEAVAAVVALAPGVAASGDEISASLEGLSRFKHPRHYVMVPEVQRAPNGKADYKWAKQTAADGIGT